MNAEVDREALPLPRRLHDCGFKWLKEVCSENHITEWEEPANQKLGEDAEATHQMWIGTNWLRLHVGRRRLAQAQENPIRLEKH